MNPYWEPDLSKGLSHSFTYDLGSGGWGNQELQEYTDSPNNSFIGSDGKSIVIRAVAELDSTGNKRYTSARLVSKACLNQERGYIEACIKTPLAKGVWFAFWLLPKAPFTWPGDGEIDICEGWDGISESGACLHWGHFNGEDWDKHRVQKRTFSGDCHHYGFAWDCKEKKLLWFTDGRPTMKAAIPKGIRDMKEFQILLNVAQGGNVMQSAPDMPSSSEMIVTDLKMYKEIPGGWKHFKSLYKSAKEGATM